jgi:hypothetical protein
MMASTTTPRSSSFIDGYEVRAGLRIPWDSNHERLSFSFFTVCDEATQQTWHGEVVLAGQVLHRTGSFDSHHLAGRAAERALVERLVSLFSW